MFQPNLILTEEQSELPSGVLVDNAVVVSMSVKTSVIKRSIDDYTPRLVSKEIIKLEQEFFKTWASDVFSAKDRCLWKTLKQTSAVQVYSDCFTAYLKLKALLEKVEPVEVHFCCSNPSWRIMEALCRSKDIRFNYHGEKAWWRYIVRSRFIWWFTILVMALLSIVVGFFTGLRGWLINIVFERKEMDTPAKDLCIAMGSESVYLRRTKEFVKHAGCISWIGIPSSHEIFKDLQPFLKLRKSGHDVRIISLNHKNLFRFWFNYTSYVIRSSLSLLRKGRLCSIGDTQAAFLELFGFSGLFFFLAIFPLLYFPTFLWAKGFLQQLKTSRVFFPGSVSVQVCTINEIFKQEGIETVHHQHGLIINQLGYRMPTNIQLAWGRFDGDLLGRLIPDTRVYTNFLPYPPPHLEKQTYKESGPWTITVISTTFFHSSSPIYGKILRRKNDAYQTLFFQTASTAFSKLSKNGTEFNVIFKIHPNEDEKIIKSLIGEVSFAYCVRKSGLEDALASADIIISAYSTAFVEGLLFAKPTVLYNPGLHDEETFISQVSPGYRFYSPESLYRHLSLIVGSHQGWQAYCEESKRLQQAYFGVDPHWWDIASFLLDHEDLKESLL